MSEMSDAFENWFLDLPLLGMLALMFGFIVVVTAGIIAVAAWIFGSSEPPSLFCEAGQRLISTPATEIIGKVPVEGVRFTCGNG